MLSERISLCEFVLFMWRESLYLPKPILSYFWNWCILRFTYYIAMQESDIISICLFPSVSCCNTFLIETPKLKIRTWHFFTCISTLNDFINWYLKLWMTQYLLLFLCIHNSYRPFYSLIEFAHILGKSAIKMKSFKFLSSSTLLMKKVNTSYIVCITYSWSKYLFK